MSDNAFDKRLKEALDNIEVAYEPDTWDALQRRMDAGAATAGQVDALFKPTLENLEMPYEQASWHLLAGKMDRRAALRKRLLISKTAEAVLLLLLLLNVGSYLGVDINIEFTPDKQPQQQNADTPIAAADRRYRAPSESISAGMMAAVSELPGIQPDVVFVSQAGHATLNPVIFDNAIQYIAGQTENGSENTAAAPHTPPPAGMLTLFALNSLATPEARSSADPYQINIHGVAIRPVKRKSQTYAGFFVATDNNQVFENYQLYRSEGFSGGIIAGMRRNKWGVETGVAYAKKQYRPERALQVYEGNQQTGYLAGKLDGVQADIVAIPLRVVGQFARMGKTKAYAVAGASAHLAAQKAYAYQLKFYEPGSLPANAANPIPGQTPDREPGTGVFEGGALAGNAYATADFGIRLERPIGRRFTAFLQPVYQKALGKNGIGPEPAQINSLSLQAGITTTML